MTTYHFDLVVVGAGSGGYAAARTARDAGANVALVDQGPLGGLCILRGCMPSKTLIATGDLAQEVRDAGELGVSAGDPTVDFRKVIARKRAIIAGFAEYRVDQIENYPLFEGPARFRSATELEVGSDDLLVARKFIVATGSSIAPPVVPGLAEAGYIDSDAALDLEEQPESMIVLGGGYVATELGQFYHRIGTKITFLIRSGHLMTHEDDDLGDALTEYLREEGITIQTHAQIESIERRGDRKVVHFVADGRQREVEAAEILYALGRIPTIEGLNLEAAGVQAHAVTGIDVDDTMRTSNPDIFAVGDVTGQYPLVHVAIQQGEVAARNAVLGTSDAIDYRLSRSRTVFSDPQVAVAGASEKELRASGIPYLRASYPFIDHGKAITIAKTKGFVKMLASPDDGRILGTAILGADASDLIHEAIVAMHFHATVFDFVKIPHLHPTMAEILTYPAEELVEALRATSPPLAAAG